MKGHKEAEMFYLLFYEVVDDYVKKREAFRDEHLRVANEAVEEGQLILGGAYANPVDGAVLVFKADDRSAVEAFVKKDPYVKNGLITSWNIREWTVVIGSIL
jgi:uncharacterized protein YciI